jgi:hypothetical protein
MPRLTDEELINLGQGLRSLKATRTQKLEAADIAADAVGDAEAELADRQSEYNDAQDEFNTADEAYDAEADRLIQLLTNEKLNDDVG